MHQLVRRPVRPPPPKRGMTKPRKLKYPHLQTLLFDPQLYLAGLDANQSKERCAKLATYPWFGISDELVPYDSKEQTQSGWMAEVERRVGTIWPGHAPNEGEKIETAARTCVDLQRGLDCEAVILASPLTHDPSSDYGPELEWLDRGLRYARDATDLPVYATVAISDLCLRYSPPESNHFIEMIADAVSARGVAGVYLVVEQGSEPNEARQCGNARVLSSALHLTHLFARESNLHVAVNFLGVFGAACSAAGARLWSSAWYKSLHRVRLADSSDGRAFPSYWSCAAGFDVNLDSDFDQLIKADLLAAIADETPAAVTLLSAASNGQSSQAVAPWAYNQSNVKACRAHFLQSAVATEQRLSGLAPAAQVSLVQDWLDHAADTTERCVKIVGKNAKSRMKHVPAWLEAFKDYRRIHNL